MTMRTISISELKARLSAQLQHVRAGERVVVTDRGEPVAMLVPYPAEGQQRLRRLETRGLLRCGEGQVTASFFRERGPSDPEASVRRALADEREDGR
jgi:prevent-host-death family protein